ncbi:MAG: PAS domain-containing protein [Sandaracinaceae bacterium]|nr:PAS domain-containing protein [Sandaracinaceae bacterium]
MTCSTPDDLARLAANHEQHVDGMGAEAVEYRLRTADGSFRWVETHSANCKDPERPAADRVLHARHHGAPRSGRRGPLAAAALRARAQAAQRRR